MSSCSREFTMFIERREFVDNSDVWIKIYQGRDNLVFTDIEFLKFRNQVNKIGKLINKTDANLAKPYTYEWLVNEKSKLIEVEEYEQVNEIQNIINMIKPSNNTYKRNKQMQLC